MSNTVVEKQASRIGNLILLVCIAAAFVVLCGLGTWQVQRLAWKEGLIAQVEARLASDPKPVATVLNSAAASVAGLDYTPVTLSGTFLPGQAFFEFTTYKGQSGWNQFAVLQVEDLGAQDDISRVLINRGFIPYDKRENWEALAPIPTQKLKIEGLVRLPPQQKPGRFLPDNKPEAREFYWRDIATMGRVAGLSEGALASWYVDAGFPGEGSEVRAYPIPGTTIVSFPNNHLQYAITWYGLAGALVLVGGWFFVSRNRKS